MVNGIDIFREYFSEYAEQYVLIGGTACDISFANSDLEFRSTKDFDMVLIIEAQTKEFAERFWQFIKDGEYINKSKSNGNPQFYRFEKPQKVGFPHMIELFARVDWILDSNIDVAPIHIDDEVSSLSAILLDDAYYETLLQGRYIINGVSVLRPECIVPFKAKAWLDLNVKLDNGYHIDSRNIKKHKNDILKIVYDLSLESYVLPETVKNDMKVFCDKLTVTADELKNLKLFGVKEADIKNVLIRTYNLDGKMNLF